MEKEKQHIEEEIPLKKINLKTKDDLVWHCPVHSFFLVLLQFVILFISFYLGHEFKYCEESLNFSEEGALEINEDTASANIIHFQHNPTNVDSLSSFVENLAKPMEMKGTISPTKRPIVKIDSEEKNEIKTETGTKCKEDQPIDWTFESGTLRGWKKTGDAFNFQPTYGDNPSKRRKGVSNHVGRYWIGGFEKYQGPEKGGKPGDYQGDSPTGFLTSLNFTIKKPFIRFLIGGGCNIKESGYVKLILPHKEFIITGNCQEKMERVEWDVSKYVSQSAYFEIYDGAGFFGHINVDDFQFATAEEKINLNIWQTAPDDIGKDIKNCMKSITNSNPHWSYQIHGNEEVEIFVKKYIWSEDSSFTKEDVFEAWQNVPNFVMKYDYWRYLVLYIHGGCYFDADSGSGNLSLDSFVRGKLTIGIENNQIYLAQFMFCAAKSHGFLRTLINEINRKLVKKDYDPKYEHFVHSTTGPEIFTQMFRLHYGLGGKINDWLTSSFLREEGVYLYGHKYWYRYLTNEKCTWLKTKWQEERKKSVQEANSLEDQL